MVNENYRLFKLIRKNLLRKEIFPLSFKIEELFGKAMINNTLYYLIKNKYQKI